MQAILTSHLTAFNAGLVSLMRLFHAGKLSSRTPTIGLRHNYFLGEGTRKAWLGVCIQTYPIHVSHLTQGDTHHFIARRMTIIISLHAG